MKKRFKHIEPQVMMPLPELASFSKYTAGEGMVLLKNDHVLPLLNKKIAIFGRIQFNYYKSGTGSGGLVNVKYVPSLIESFLSDPNVKVNKLVYETYKSWVSEFPFDSGNGQWASEPWNQEEMSMHPNIIQDASKESDVALVVIGRTAGEDKDNKATKGSYYLTDEEDNLLKLVTNQFKKTVVVLNVGSAIDLSFMDRYTIDGLVFAWHGGQYGALAIKDILLGYKSPSGKLPISLVKSIEKEPAYHNFGHKGQVIYEEDIYVGYRYFETFDKEAVRYPFGYGLTYSKFKIEPLSFDMVDKHILFKVKVTNTGKVRAKEVVQVYVSQPQGLLGKPKLVLAAFSKTKELEPKESMIIDIKIDFYNLSSYDDVGYIYKSTYVLEKGNYKFYIGNSSRHHEHFGDIKLEDDIITKLSRELSAPIKAFKRIKPDANFNITFEDVPLRTTNYNELIQKNIPKTLPTHTKPMNLMDVYNNKYTMDAFVGSLSVDNLVELTRGEGMSSPKVTAGTAAAFGGVTEELLGKGIPIACAADGPSGIRMDSGFYASSLPNGISLASTFDVKLVENLYQLLAFEMKAYQVDLILGPGMNIIRHPLNGRNFEYYSEDPLLTGLMASSAIIGLHKEGVSGTLKHLYGNNQETDRLNVDAVISERAQREIYLKAFEIAIKVGKARAIMTSYNPVNSLWTASNFEINNLLLRKEWGFKGILVTDWWAKMNDFNGPGDAKNTKAMIISQNDLYMVVSDAKANSNQDNTKESYLNGSLKLAHLQKVAKNILTYLMTTPAFNRMHNLKPKPNMIKRNDWFKTNQKPLNIPTLDSSKLSDEKSYINPLIFNQKLDNLSHIRQKSSKSYFNKEKTSGILTIHNQSDTNIYHLNTLSTVNNDANIINIDTLNILDYPVFGNKAWDTLKLDFNQAIYSVQDIEYLNNELHIIKKDAILSFPVLLDKAGKYLIDFTISSDSSNLAQIPFSLYLDNTYKTTVTIHGTNGNKVQARAIILAEEGPQILSIKFNKSSNIIYEIKVTRHG